MTIAVVSGSAGLVGSAAARAFAALGFDVIGIDNDMRAHFFGPEASTAGSRAALERDLGPRYRHVEANVADREAMLDLFSRHGADVSVVVHTAAQPSHDWAATDAFTDFDVNATGTLHLLEATRRHCPAAPFLFTSTNKVYGDTPNRLPMIELETRWEIDPSHRYAGGIAEDMSIDTSLHSLFGVSKASADLLVQEYGRYFDMPTVCFRAGTITGPGHAAAALHGFLAYLMRCAMTGSPYEVIGYKGKQVRDAIHCEDLVAAFLRFFESPRPAAVYNIGGGRTSNVSVLEAIELAGEIVGRPLEWHYRDEPRVGDHIWWISDNGRLEADYPGWTITRDHHAILREIHERNRASWT